MVGNQAGRGRGGRGATCCAPIRGPDEICRQSEGRRRYQRSFEMKVYRKVIPRIAKDVIRVLLANRCIEIEEGRRDEAELDIAGVFVRYLNDLEKLNQDTKDALVRHKLGPEAFPRVKLTLASKRNFALGDDVLEHLLSSIIESLFDSRQVLEVFSEDGEIRETLHTTVSKYIGVDEELDREVRHRLKAFREGTPEWEDEYARLINSMRSKTTPVPTSHA